MHIPFEKREQIACEAAHSLGLQGLTVSTRPILLVLLAAKHAIRLLHRLLLHYRKHMTVNPQGDADMAMP